jgi:ATP-dependent Clp protease ATP-binding subunit ClpA
MSSSDARMIVSQFAINLNQRARQNKIDPLIGRQSEVGQIVEILARKNKNNVLLVGHPGTGKTQIVEGLARLIVEKTVPTALLDKEIWSLDVSSVVAGTKFRGDFEERMKNLITALRSLPNVILFVDEIHMIMGAGGGGSQNSMDVANILKPALGRGEIRTIGSTTFEEYRKHFEKDRALLRRFQKQDVHEPSSDDAKLILRGLLAGFEKYHGVSYHADIPSSAVDLSVKYVHDRYLPDKAIDLVDAAGAAAKIQGAATVSVGDIETQLSKMAKIGVDVVQQQQTDVTRDLMSNIQQKLFGQPRAVEQVVETVWMSLSGLRENTKTMGSFLFSGPSGTGKTELARLLAQQLNYQFVRFDMSEFQEKHTVSRLIGSPPGYVGYADGNAGSGALINALEQNPQCVLLMDEIEKSHPDVTNIFLQAMDRGMITSSNQKTVSLQNTILIFTSNLGAADMERNAVGFGRQAREGEDTSAIQQFFAPEFRNRLDAIVSFGKLTSDTCELVVDKFVRELNSMCEAKNIRITVDPAAKKWLVSNGFDSAMGARPLGRCIDAHIKKPLAKEILFGKLTSGGSVLVTVDQDSGKIRLDCLPRPVTNSFDMMQDSLLDMEIDS